MTIIERLLLANGKVIITTNKEYKLGDYVPELESIEVNKYFTLTLKPLWVTRVATKAEYIAQLDSIIPRGYYIATIGFKKRYYEVQPKSE